MLGSIGVTHSALDPRFEVSNLTEVYEFSIRKGFSGLLKNYKRNKRIKKKTPVSFILATCLKNPNLLI